MITNKELQKELAQEENLKKLINNKIYSLQVYNPQNSDYLAHSLAEIMVLAKKLYTKILPEFVETSTADKEKIWEEITGLRMHLMHTRDCIDEFDSNLLNLMSDSSRRTIELDYCNQEDDEEDCFSP
ncbi:MAG: hypothetical protein ACLFQV_02405 [Vulcanimicrobiota bacterium]